ncbi:MAG: hypothetical protein N2556_10315, partial [Anaerolineae bacterium]|nr:hypothetical protein [Anaerolineae bacterium]
DEAGHLRLRIPDGPGQGRLQRAVAHGPPDQALRSARQWETALRSNPASGTRTFRPFPDRSSQPVSAWLKRKATLRGDVEFGGGGYGDIDDAVGLREKERAIPRADTEWGWLSELGHSP